MARRLIYVGQDDDLSDLAGKVQASDPGDEITLAVPAGAQAFQTPLNVRLLRSIAMKRGLVATIVSPDPRIQEVVRSAGLVAYSSVAALEGGVPVTQPRPGFRPAEPASGAQAPFLPGPPPVMAHGRGGAPVDPSFQYTPTPASAPAPAGQVVAPLPASGGPLSAAGGGGAVPGVVPPPRTGPWGAPIAPSWPPVAPDPAVPVPAQDRTAAMPRAPFLPASPAGPAPRPGSPWTALSEIPEDEEPLSPWAGARAAIAVPTAGAIDAPAAPPVVPVVAPPPPGTGPAGRRQPPAPPRAPAAGRLRLPPRRVMYAVAAGVLAVGIVLFLLLGTSATVTLTVAETPLTVDPTIQGTTSTTLASQPNYILSKQITTPPESQTFQASPTGTQAVPGVAATGYLVLASTGTGPCSSGCSFTLTPAYEFETTGISPTVLFGVTSQTPVIIPGTGGASNEIPVTALTTGAVGNVPPHTITVCTSAAQDWCTADDLQADNPVATTGGVNAATQTVASTSDIANWQEQLGQIETQLGQKATADLSAKAGQDKVALDPSGGGKSVTFVVSPASFPPATAGTVMSAETVTVTMTAQETVYNPSDLSAIVLKDLEASTNLPAGDTLVPGQLQLNNLQIIQAGSDGTFALSVQGVDYYHSSLNLGSLTSQLTGRNPGSVDAIIRAAIPNVQSVTVDETPVQLLFMPFSSSSIRVAETFVTVTPSASSSTG